MKKLVRVGFQVASTQDGRAQVDGAVAISVGEEIFSLPEERLSRIKHDGDVWRGLSALLLAADLSIDRVDEFCVSTCGENVPDPDAPVWLRKDRRLCLTDLDVESERIRWCRSHHASHAFEALHSAQLVGRLRTPAMVFVADRVGQLGEHQSVFHFSEKGLVLIWRYVAPTGFAPGFGAVYDHVTEHLGWSANFDTGKTMALAATLNHDISPRSAMLFDVVDGRLDMKTPEDSVARSLLFESIAPGASAQTNRLSAGAKLASQVQRELAAAVSKIIRRLLDHHHASALYFGGGLATNCALLGSVSRDFPHLTIAGSLCPGDTGQGVGNVVMAHYAVTGCLPSADRFNIDRLFRANIREPERAVEWSAEFVSKIADELQSGIIVMTCMQRHEPGPRALGFHSIFADARDRKNRERINSLIKRRETFRPFGAVLGERACAKWFAGRGGDFMDIALRASDSFANQYPAVIHDDGSVRVQCAGALTRGSFLHLLLEALSELGVDALLNTSLNASGGPIIEDVEEAIELARHSKLRCIIVTDQRGKAETIEVNYLLTPE
jgi:carbamoyltransferase